MGTGGPAVLLPVHTDGELKRTLGALAELGLTFGIIGGASNVLFPDAGTVVPILSLEGDFKTIEVVGNAVKAGGGAVMGALVKAALSADLRGLEIAVGLPGTVGGAVGGNAGTKEEGLAHLIGELELVRPNGETVVLPKADLRPVYRSLNLPADLAGSVIARVSLELAPKGAGLEGFEGAEAFDYEATLQSRKAKQPSGRSLGSVFKNPPGDFAGRLIDGRGLKGRKIGGAQISEKHANFILNVGGARSADVLELALLARDEVLAHTGIRLWPEIKIWDAWARDVGLPEPGQARPEGPSNRPEGAK
jgi:UDP-N-acetylmuramate dehydrogenase